MTLNELILKLQEHQALCGEYECSVSIDTADAFNVTRLDDVVINKYEATDTPDGYVYEICLHGEFIQGASKAGKIGGKSKSEKKRKACSRNMKKNRRPDLGAKASVEARRKNGTFFFSKEYQENLQNRLKQNEIGPYSRAHKLKVSKLGKEKAKRPTFNGKTWESSYEAAIETNIPASTIRYRSRNKIMGWTYEK